MSLDATRKRSGCIALSIPEQPNSSAQLHPLVYLLPSCADAEGCCRRESSSEFSPSLAGPESSATASMSGEGAYVFNFARGSFESVSSDVTVVVEKSSIVRFDALFGVVPLGPQQWCILYVDSNSLVGDIPVVKSATTFETASVFRVNSFGCYPLVANVPPFSTIEDVMTSAWAALRCNDYFKLLCSHLSLDGRGPKDSKEAGCFFYSHTADVSESISKQVHSTRFPEQPLHLPPSQYAMDGDGGSTSSSSHRPHDHASRYEWNSHISFLVPEVWRMPMVRGMYSTREVNATAISRTDESNATAEKVWIGLISRQSRKFAGTRYNRRGIDVYGNAANTVETEQLVWSATRLSSYVLYRGSVPVRWSQPADLSIKPTISITSDSTRKKRAMEGSPHFGAGCDPVTPSSIHLQSMFQDMVDGGSIRGATYLAPSSPVHGRAFSPDSPFTLVCVDLLRDVGSEGTLQKAYEEAVREFQAFRSAGCTGNSSGGGVVMDVTYRHIPFSHGTSPADVYRKLKSVVQESSAVIGTTVVGPQPTAETDSETCSQAEGRYQRGAFRANCLDCVDRTNVMQFLVAALMLETQLRDVLPFSPDDSAPAGYDDPHSVIAHGMPFFPEMWQDNGNAVGFMYTKTAAQKAFYYNFFNGDVDSSRSLLPSLLRDGRMALHRYLCAVLRDGVRQDALSLLTGQHDPLLYASAHSRGDDVEVDSPMTNINPFDTNLAFNNLLVFFAILACVIMISGNVLFLLLWYWTAEESDGPDADVGLGGRLSRLVFSPMPFVSLWITVGAITVARVRKHGISYTNRPVLH